MPGLEDAFIIHTIPETLSLTAKQKKAELKRQERRFEVKKSGVLLYLSKEGGPLNHNLKAKDEKEEVIACRHLAGYLAYESRRGVKDYHQSFQSIERIKQVPYLLDNRHDAEERQYKATYYHLFAIDKLGVALHQVASLLKANEETTLLLKSENHEMAITLICKNVLDKKQQYIVKFYDPNLTSAHQRAICPTLKSIKTLSLNTFLSKEALRAYFPIMKSAMIFSTKIRDNTPPLVILDIKNKTEIIYYCASTKLNDKIDELLGQYANQKNANLVKMLCASDERGHSFIHFSLRNEHANGVNFYINTLLRSKLTPQERYEIFAGKTGNLELSLLYFSLALDYPLLTKIIMRGILNSGLSNQKKTELFLARDSQGEPTIVNITKENSFQTIDVFLETVLNSDLTDQDKIASISNAQEAGMPALFAAFLYGHHETIDTFLRHILHSDLTPKDKVLLLSAKYHQSPGFTAAIYEGHLETVGVFLKAILNSNLSSDEKTSLLKSENEEGIPGLFIALQKGHVAIINLMMSEISNSSLSKEDKAILLAAKQPAGFSRLFTAFLDGLSQTVSVYSEHILKTDCMENKDKIDLLMARNSQGYAGFYAACVGRHYETAQAFSKEVVKSPLSKGDKILLLLAKNEHDADSTLRVAIKKDRKIASILITAMLEIGLTAHDIYATLDYKLKNTSAYQYIQEVALQKQPAKEAGRTTRLTPATFFFTSEPGQGEKELANLPFDTPLIVEV
jgi:hypothetical protein